MKKNDILFREGDPSDAMFVIKTGKIAITKAKGSGEIILAELGPGDMLGEMAFFDNKPRSAGARAMIDNTTVIELPFKALNAQFKTFPEWLKAVVRTVNTHLRNANQRIKNLEKSEAEDDTVFPPHTITRLMSIISLVGQKYGEKTPEGLVLPSGTLRKFTIQVFQQPTHKMQKIMDVLQGLGHMKVEDMGEGRQKITVMNLDFLWAFVEFYNDYLFKDESKRVTIVEKEMKTLKALIFYGKKVTPNDKGVIKINLTQMQNDSMRDLGALFSVDDIDPLVSKGLLTEKVTMDGGLGTSFVFKDVETIFPYWEIIHTLSKITKT